MVMSCICKFLYVLCQQSLFEVDESCYYTKFMWSKITKFLTTWTWWPRSKTWDQSYQTFHRPQNLETLCIYTWWLLLLLSLVANQKNVVLNQEWYIFHFANIWNSSIWERNYKIRPQARPFLWGTLPPPSVYLNRHWHHSRTRPLPSIFAYCKWSKTGRWEGLEMRLIYLISGGVALPDFHKETKHQLIPNDRMITAPCVQKVVHSCTWSGAHKLLVTQANIVENMTPIPGFRLLYTVWLWGDFLNMRSIAKISWYDLSSHCEWAAYL